MREAQIWRLVEALTGLAIIVWAVMQAGDSIGAGDVFVFAVMLAVGAAMLYSFWLALATAAFWVVRISAVADLFEGIYQTARWPISMYPGWLRYGLTFLVPIGLAVTVPAEAVTARLEWTSALTSTVVAMVLAVVARRVFHIGLRSYSGASA